MRVGREERTLPRSKLEGIRKYVPRGYVFKICTKERGRRREVFDTIFEPILDCFADAIKLFATMKSRPPTRMKFTRRGSWRGAEWEKLDIQKVSRKVNLISVRRAIIGQQFFFFFSNIFLFLPSPLPCFSAPRLRYRGAARPEVAQTRQGSYLLEERVLRVTAGCSLFLDYCYAGTENWQRGRKTERAGGGERMEECVWEGGKKESEGNEMDGGGTRKRASQWKHREPCLPLSKIVIVSLGIVIRCSWPWRLSINFLVSFASSFYSVWILCFFLFHFIFIHENNC